MLSVMTNRMQKEPLTRCLLEEEEKVPLRRGTQWTEHLVRNIL